MNNSVAAGSGASSLGDIILKLPDYTGKFMWIAGALLLAPFVLRQFRVAVSLMYTMKFHRDRSELGWARWALVWVATPLRMVGAFFKVIQVTLANPGAIILKKFSIADLIRIWIEHDIFERRLEGSWAARPEKQAGLNEALAIVVKHPGVVTEQAKAIDRYCAKVDKLGITAAHEQPGFISPIQIKSGFIAAFHLLSGLQSQFSDTWPGIMKGFESEAQLDAALKRHDLTLNFQQIQSFIYYCWLLWGPSIPVCSESCKRWDKDYLWLQYGFGDESNSIDIVAERPLMMTQMKNLNLKKNDGGKGVMAVPASVIGRLRYDNEKTFDTSQIAPAPLDRLGSKTTERRALMFVDKIKSDGENSDRSLYYSGYIWVSFLILAEGRIDPEGDEKDWFPLHPDRERRGTAGANPLRSAMPWKDSIPFFEHGNFADPETCAFGKRQVVEKALSGLANMVRERGDAAFPLRFAYASAIDDPNCNWNRKAPRENRSDQLAFPELAGGALIVDMLEARLKEEMANPASAMGAIFRANPNLIDFGRFTGVSGDHPHSACFLPEHVGRHFGELATLTGGE